MQQTHLITIIIPTYGRSEFLLRSLKSVLNQTYSNIEIIIVDDNGKDTENQLNTYQKLKQFLYKDNKIKYVIHEKNLNGAAARNTGIKESKGEYICFLDDDDEFEKEKIEKQYNKLEKNKEKYGACYCGHSRIKNGKKISTYLPQEEGNILLPLLLQQIDACTGSTLMIRRETLDKVVGFDVNFKRHQDYEFIARVAYFTNIAVVSESLVRIHMHKGSYSQKKYEDIIATRKQYNNKMKNYTSGLTERQKRDFNYNNYLVLAKSAVKYKKAKDLLDFSFKSRSPKIIIDLIKDGLVYIKGNK